MTILENWLGPRKGKESALKNAKPKNLWEKAKGLWQETKKAITDTRDSIFEVLNYQNKSETIPEEITENGDTEIIPITATEVDWFTEGEILSETEYEPENWEDIEPPQAGKKLGKKLAAAGIATGIGLSGLYWVNSNQNKAERSPTAPVTKMTPEEITPETVQQITDVLPQFPSPTDEPAETELNPEVETMSREQVVDWLKQKDIVSNTVVFERGKHGALWHTVGENLNVGRDRLEAFGINLDEFGQREAQRRFHKMARTQFNVSGTDLLIGESATWNPEAVQAENGWFTMRAVNKLNKDGKIELTVGPAVQELQYYILADVIMGENIKLPQLKKKESPKIKLLSNLEVKSDSTDVAATKASEDPTLEVILNNIPDQRSETNVPKLDFEANAERKEAQTTILRNLEQAARQGFTPFIGNDDGTFRGYTDEPHHRFIEIPDKNRNIIGRGKFPTESELEDLFKYNEEGLEKAKKLRNLLKSSIPSSGLEEFLKDARTEVLIPYFQDGYDLGVINQTEYLYAIDNYGKSTVAYEVTVNLP